MDNFNLFELMGMADPRAAEREEAKETKITVTKEKKEVAKREKKSDKSAKKKDVNETFSNVAVDVITPDCIYEYDSSFKNGSFTANDIIQDLISSKGLEELRTPFADIIFEDNKGYFVRALNCEKKSYLNYAIAWPDDESVTVVYGMEQNTYYKNEFIECIDSGISISVNHVFKKYILSFDYRKNMIPLYDPKSNVIVLVEHTLQPDTPLSTPVNVLLLGDDTLTINGDDGGKEFTTTNLLDYLKKEEHITEASTFKAKIATIDKHYMPIYFGNIVHNKSIFWCNKDASETEVETVFETPFILHTYFGYNITVENSTFDTKYVKKELIEDYLCSHFSDFRTAEKVSISYIAEENMVYCSVHTGKKGCIPFRSPSHSVEIIRKKPVLTVYTKIPKSFKEEMLEHFKRFLPNEDVCQVWYDRVKNEYFLHYPQVYIRTPEFIDYNRCDRLPTFNQYLVASFHSHGYSDPFFSPDDDTDEKAPCIFGVFGNLNLGDRNKFRVGYNDYFSDIEEVHIFA